MVINNNIVAITPDRAKFELPMLRRAIVLIAGPVGAGKTTFGDELKRQGLVDEVLEMDEAHKMLRYPEWSTSEAGPTVWRQMRGRVYQVLAGSVRALMRPRRRATVAVSGVWPQENGFLPFMNTLSQLQATILCVHLDVEKDEAFRRIVDRTGGEYTAEEWSEFISKAGGWPAHVEASRFERTAPGVEQSGEETALSR